MEKLIEAFNQDILPFIPEKGPLGSSGDFSQLSHLALGLMGEGKIWDFNTKKYVSASIVLKKKQFEPIEFQAKDAISVIQGIDYIIALGCEALVRAERTALQADIISSITFETQCGK